MSLAHLLRPELGELRAYVPASPDGIVARLDSNEAPRPSSNTLHEIVMRAIGEVALERYPDARALALKEAIAKRAGTAPEEIFVGCGSDEVISLLVNALARPQKRQPSAVIVSPTPSFVMYRVTSRVHGLKSVEVPLDAEWDLEVRSLSLAAQTMEPNVVFIASPNNPTGNCMSVDRVRAVIEAAPRALVVLDEAYADYAGKSLRSLRAEYTNVAILRTVSKLGLAALRVGWLEADPALVAELDKARQPFNVSATSQAGAAAALTEGWIEVEKIVADVVSERERLARELGAIAGATITPSDSNFFWVKTEAPAETVLERLTARGVLVRSFHESGGRLKHQLRITIGSRAENDRLLDAWKEATA